jgi:ParB family chromosome partitioning protein
MKTGKMIERIAIEQLLGHPDNPNRMSKPNLKKLHKHIKDSGDYEPVIVRRHPEKDGFFEILNGHHRTKVLRELGIETVDCVVWEVSDERALMLLATLNRLNGKDDVTKRANLIGELSEKFNMKELTAILPETKQAIERLKTISTSGPLLRMEEYEIPETLVYIVTAEQKAFVEKQIKNAIDPSKGATNAEQTAWALVEILRYAKV